MSVDQPPSRYAREEVFSTLDYPPDYKIRPVREQVAVLHDLFPELGPADEILVAQELPEGAEGWFALPRWDRLASSHHQAVIRAFAMIELDRPFKNRRPGQLGPIFLRSVERTTAMLAQIAAAQQRDILLVPAQFGLRHRGRSARRAVEVLGANEFGLGVFHTAIMLITHPERLVGEKELRIECIGDSHHVDEVPMFSIASGGLEFGACYCGDANAFFGAATGFLPTSE